MITLSDINAYKWNIRYIVDGENIEIEGFIFDFIPRIGEHVIVDDEQYIVDDVTYNFDDATITVNMLYA